MLFYYSYSFFFYVFFGTGSPALGPVPTPLIGACARLIIIPTAETVPVSTPTAAVPGAGTVLTPVVRHGPSFSFVGRRS
jgi:hypothetical protein